MKTLFTFILLITALPMAAWKGMPMSDLHIDGRWLCDSNGNHITLHGYGQTYSAYFNDYQWCRDAYGNVQWGETHNVTRCLAYNKGLIKQIDEAGWKCNWLRLHMDPHWSNNEAKVREWESQNPGKYYSENLIVAFDESLFRKYLDELFVPMAEYANEYGLYVVMRPPGVCPEKLTVGDEYNQYLLKVWSIVCSHPKLKNNPYIMFELANEPINMNDGSGNYTSWSDGSQRKCTEFFQSVVDTIRALGCNNILWVPGLAYQQNYQGYVKYPIEEHTGGKGIGYAVHCYPGWYGSDSEVASAEQQVVTNGAGYMEFLEGWNNSLYEVSQHSPLLITEMDWAPKKYDKSWGKATTGKLFGVGFGANFKYIMDRTGNVSWMLFTGPEHLAQYNDALEYSTSYMQQAAGYNKESTTYKQLVEKAFLTDPEACVRPCYRWFQEYAQPDWTFDAGAGQRYEDSVRAERFMFPGTDVAFNPSYWEKGSITNNSDGSRTIVLGQYGFGGWNFSSGLDLSGYKYLVVKLAQAPSGGWSLRLFDQNNYWGDRNSDKAVNSLTTVVNLQNNPVAQNTSQKIDPSHIYILGFWDYGGNQLRISKIYLTNNDDYSESANGVEIVLSDDTNSDVYLLNGMRVKDKSTIPHGTIVIENGKKVLW